MRINKTILNIFAVLILATLIFISYIYLDTRNKVESTNITYNGVNGKVFNYKVDSNGLKCVLESDNTVFNTDKIKYRCYDRFIGLIHKTKEVSISGLLHDTVKNNKDMKKIFEFSYPYHSCYVMNSKNGISLMKISLQENMDYKAEIFHSLFIDESDIVQIHEDLNFENLSDISEYKAIRPGTIIGNIEPEFLEEYIQRYLNIGFKKIEE